MLSKIKEMTKGLINKIKYLYINKKFEKENTKFLGKCYVLESDDFYDLFKITSVRDYNNKINCLIIHTLKKYCADTDNVVDTGKYRYAIDSENMSARPYENTYIKFIEMTLDDISNFSEITNDCFNSILRDVTDILLSLNPIKNNKDE